MSEHCLAVSKPSSDYVSQTLIRHAAHGAVSPASSEAAQTLTPHATNHTKTSVCDNLRDLPQPCKLSRVTCVHKSSMFWHSEATFREGRS